MRILSSVRGITLAMVILVPLSGNCHEAAVSHPQTPPKSNEELARKVENPISDLTSALIENNLNPGAGYSNGLQNVLNLAEFYPVRFNDDFGLVQRAVIPVISQPSQFSGGPSQFGLGNIQYQALVTSVNKTGFVFGFGPAVLIPTAYPSQLGTNQWSAGPALAAVAVMGDWVGGVLLNQVWSFTTIGYNPPVNLGQLQPFVYYNLPSAWYVASTPVMTVNWKMPRDNRWTVPVGGGVGKVFRIWKQPLKTELQIFDEVVSPQLGPDWSLRVQFQFLFPSEEEHRPTPIGST